MSISTDGGSAEIGLAIKEDKENATLRLPDGLRYISED